MRRRSPGLLILGSLACVAAGAEGFAQSLPPTAITGAAQPATASAHATDPFTPLHTAPATRRAEVSFAAGKLSVRADSSSLNAILAEIARQTGMRITGGVREETVFGAYGPADPGTVLTALLDGTSSNMLLKLDGQSRPVELVLTSRNGGPTPPSPAPVASMVAERPPANDPPPQQVVPQPAPPPPPSPVQAAAAAVNNDQPATTSQPATSSDGGQKTPQQIFDELMKLQQANKTTPK